MKSYEDVTISKGYRKICDCEQFLIDEQTHRLELRNVARQQDLWALPIQGDIMVSLWVIGDAGNMEEGRMNLFEVVPAEADPPTRDPNRWHGNYKRVEMYGAAARQ